MADLPRLAGAVGAIAQHSEDMLAVGRVAQLRPSRSSGVIVPFPGVPRWGR